VKAWIEGHEKGPVDLQTGKSGQFDIVVNGAVAWSRYDTGRFPADADLQKLDLG
jgi:predicted Rdx family selenoprotein